ARSRRAVGGVHHHTALGGEHEPLRGPGRPLPTRTSRSSSSVATFWNQMVSFLDSQVRDGEMAGCTSSHFFVTDSAADAVDHICHTAPGSLGGGAQRAAVALRRVALTGRRRHALRIRPYMSSERCSIAASLDPFAYAGETSWAACSTRTSTTALTRVTSLPRSVSYQRTMSSKRDPSRCTSAGPLNR